MVVWHHFGYYLTHCFNVTKAQIQNYSARNDLSYNLMMTKINEGDNFWKEKVETNAKKFQGRRRENEV